MNEEQISLLSHTEYEIGSPYDSAEAANTLLQLLEEPNSNLLFSVADIRP